MNAQEVEDWLAEHHVPIGLLYDGQVLTRATIADLLTLVLELQELGYRVTDHTIDRIRSEANA